MQEHKFIVTKKKGKLAKWLRIRGYDTIYCKKRETAELVITALRDGRTLLTRSSFLTKHKGINIINIKHDQAEEQVTQLAQFLGLAFGKEDIFQRCIEYNHPLEKIEKSEVKEQVPDYVYDTNEKFKKYTKC